MHYEGLRVVCHCLREVVDFTGPDTADCCRDTFTAAALDREVRFLLGGDTRPSVEQATRLTEQLRHIRKSPVFPGTMRYCAVCGGFAGGSEMRLAGSDDKPLGAVCTECSGLSDEEIRAAFARHLTALGPAS